MDFNVYSPETAMGKAPNAQGDLESSYVDAIVKYVLGYIPINMTKFQCNALCKAFTVRASLNGYVTASVLPKL